MRKHHLLPALLGAGFALFPFHAAHADLILYYNFDDEVLGSAIGGESITNLGTLSTAGTLSLGSGAGNSVNFVISGIPGGLGGNALQLNPGADTYETATAPHINTSFTATALNITGTTTYTAMAWVNFANANGDNMIFGQLGTAPTLHHGSRNGNLHSGHWGDDLEPGTNSQPGTWHHVAYTNDGPNGAQSIYFDGLLVGGPGATANAAGMDLSQLVAIGTSRNEGSFSGMIDEVKVYDTLLTQAEIQEAATVVPEPASLALIALGAGFVARRRRGVR